MLIRLSCSPILTLLTVTLLLQGCVISQTSVRQEQPPTAPAETVLMPIAADQQPTPITEKRKIVVNPGYYLQSGGHPQTHVTSDEQWVNMQPDQGYTIQIQPNEKPAIIAKHLYQAPKSHRGAQFKINETDQVKYTGAYGTYKTEAEALAVLNALPENVKSAARISKWVDIKQNVVKDTSSTPMSRPEIDTSEEPTVSNKTETTSY